MEVSTGSYVVTTVVGLIITVVVGRLLRPAGYDLLREVLGERSSTTSLNRLLVTLYYLFALGLLTLVATTRTTSPGSAMSVMRPVGVWWCATAATSPGR
jgi:hypothetical protein